MVRGERQESERLSCPWEIRLSALYSGRSFYVFSPQISRNGFSEIGASFHYFPNMNIHQSVILVQALKNPALYDHPVTHWQVLETHISWVLLTGSFAYKIKKPVDLGFVDFSTLEKRHTSCLEEVRLNKRLAPELYMGVVHISGSPERPILGSGGPPIEYAVQMKQFPLEATLDHVVTRGELDPKHLDQLAIDIARFHGTISVADAGSLFGTPKLIAKTVQEVIEEISLQQDVFLPQESFQEILRWMGHEHARLKSGFATRKAGGYIRECHGDMHLANLVLLQGQIVPFDGIEFSEPLRWIDVMNDLAFPVMDLMARGRSDLGYRLLNAYLEETGDYLGVSVFRYYQVYRALVRAKVASIGLNQSGKDGNKTPVFAEQLHRYLTVARKSIRSNLTGIILMHGVSGSGKTTISQSLLESIGAIRVRSDVERKRLFDVETTTRSRDEEQKRLYGQRATDETYQRLLELTEILVDAGYPVIVDATFLQERFRKNFQRLTKEHSIPFVIVDIHASPSTIGKRVTARLTKGQDASDADVGVVLKQEQSQDPLTKSEMPYVVRIDSEEIFTPDAIREMLTRK